MATLVSLRSLRQIFERARTQLWRWFSGKREPVMPWDHSDIHDDPSVDELIRQIPPEIYKYSGLSGDRLEWMRRLIVDSELYFASPSSFNDPLDCRIPTRFEAPEHIVEKHWRGIASQPYIDMPDRGREARIQQLVRDSATPEGRAKLTEQLLNLLARNGTVSFAKDPNNMLMWSYYAEGHSGIAVRFGMDLSQIAAFGQALEAQGTQLFPVRVEYSDDFPNCNYYTATTHERLKKLLGTKSAEWTHEGEWRFVLPDRTGYLKIPPTAITGVVLGMRIDPCNEAIIREWISKRSPKIDLLRVSHIENSFRLHLIPA
jgi:hypothetical protein